MPRDSDTHRRRPVLKVLGATAAGALASPVGSATAGGREDEREGSDGEVAGRQTDEARPPVIHSHFGYSGTSDDEVPERLDPDETVGLHVDEELIVAPEPPDFDLALEFGAFYFDPVGLHVEPGSIVEFDFASPEHTVTAFHPGQERQQRVPDGVPAFSSTVNEVGGFWLYRFEESGVYDVFCSPHEWGGMAMRIVVGEATEEVVRAPGRPPLPLTGALLGSGLPPEDPDLGVPELAPDEIVDAGAVGIDDVELDLAVTLTGPQPPEEDAA